MPPVPRPRWASQIRQLDAINQSQLQRQVLLAQCEALIDGLDYVPADDMCTPITRTRRPSTWDMATRQPKEQYL